jgi:hypothetical protein
LRFNTSGNNDIAIGYQAGTNILGGNSNNIHIGSIGSLNENGTIRIGGNTSLGDPATPVTFRHQKAFADGSKPIEYGLIAEEVAEVYPDLVAKGADGQIEAVKY